MMENARYVKLLTLSLLLGSCASVDDITIEKHEIETIDLPDKETNFIEESSDETTSDGGVDEGTDEGSGESYDGGSDKETGDNDDESNEMSFGELFDMFVYFFMD